MARFIAAQCTVAVALLGVVNGKVNSSFWPHAFDAFASKPSVGRKGFRRYHHIEAHHHPDGSELHLRWEVEANPDTIMSVDMEHTNGMRVLECSERHLQLWVPERHVANVGSWHHIVASDHLHGCSHLQGIPQAGDWENHNTKNLYHRVEEVSNVDRTESPGNGAKVTFRTSELKSPAEIFPFVDWSYRYTPVEAKELSTLTAEQQQRRLQGFQFQSSQPTFTNQVSPGGAGGSSLPGEDGLPNTKSESMDSAVDGDVEMGNTQYDTSFTPTTENVDSIFNLGAADKQMSKLHWNWDYDANCTKIQSSPISSQAAKAG